LGRAIETLQHRASTVELSLGELLQLTAIAARLLPFYGSQRRTAGVVLSIVFEHSRAQRRHASGLGELTLQLLILLFLLLRFAPIGMSTTTYLRFTQRNVCRFDFVTSAHEVLTLDLQRTFQLHDVDEAIEDSVTFAHLVFEALHQTTELAEHEGFAFLQRGETNP